MTDDAGQDQDETTRRRLVGGAPAAGGAVALPAGAQAAASVTRSPLQRCPRYARSFYWQSAALRSEALRPARCARASGRRPEVPAGLRP
jgi:hypothetical protein